MGGRLATVSLDDSRRWWYIIINHANSDTCTTFQSRLSVLPTMHPRMVAAPARKAHRMSEVPFPVLGPRSDTPAREEIPVGLCQCGCGKPLPTSALRNHSRFLVGHKTPLNVEARFWQQVQKTDTCWLWMGKVHNAGYGTFYIGRYREITTHTFSWTMHFGPIPAGQCVLHECDVRNCVRPDHLFLGTRTDNMRDAAAKGRMRNRRRLTADERNSIIERSANGESQTSIAADFGFVPNYIGWILKHCGKPNHRQSLPGSLSPRAKLTEDDVREIRTRCESGEGPAQIAKQFNVAPCTIINISRRRSWRHLA